MKKLNNPVPPEEIERPPFLRKWPNVYVLVTVVLVVQIILFHIFTLYFA